jgi:uncharacterized protein (TIGR03437 family)
MVLMLTLFRLAPVRFTTFGLLASFFALGCFDTVRAQNLTVSPSILVFTAAPGGNPKPATQMVSVGGTGNYIISTNATWIFASTGAFAGTGGTAPDIITVQINSTTLASGSYNATITLQPTNGSQFTTISVSLTVTGSGSTTSTISAAPSQLSFGYELGQSLPTAQTTQITSSGISLPFSFYINFGNTGPGFCPVGWMQATVSNNTTPATLTVSIANPGSGLSPGTCSGNVSITSTTALNGTTTTLVGVILFVSAAGSPLLNVSVPNALASVNLQQGGAPVQFNITLSSSDQNSLGFTAQVTAGLGWLAISPSGGTVPGGGGTVNINVQVTPGTVLSPGTYLGSITIGSSGLLGGSLKVPVTMILAAKSAVTVTPSGTIGFNQLQGGTLPAAQTVTLSGSTSATFLTVATPQQNVPVWLMVSPANGSLTSFSPATLTFSISANTLLQGVYTTQVAISFSNSSVPTVTILVSLTVAPPAPALVPTPATVSFSYQSGSSQSPPAQAITISDPAAGSLNYTVASISDSWLSVSPSTGTTPGTLSVSVSPQSLAAGSYSGSFTVASPGVASLTVSVTVFVSANSTPQPFLIANNSSGLGGQLAPGEIIYIKGSGLGPGNGVAGPPYSTAMAGVEVTFNGIPGTLLYVSSTQIDVVVPYEVAGSASTNLVVTYQTLQSAGMVQPVAAVALGLSTNNQAGNGQAAVLNQDNSYNTAASPAPQGSYISVYGTGGGQTSPPSFDGEVSPTTSLLPLAAQSVTATIGGKAAPVVFAGAAPGEVTGAVQFNIQVPTGVTGAALPIVVFVNGVASQTGPTVAVQ